jgi:hypothetical protein
MMAEGTHYSKDCLCEGCKQAGNRRYIGGGVYNINESKPMNKINKILEEFDAGCNADNISDPPSDKKWIKEFIKTSLTTLLTETLEEIVPEQENVKSFSQAEVSYCAGWNEAIQQIKDNAKKLNIEI